MRRLFFLIRTGAAVAVRPGLWRTALVQLRRFAPDGWWRRAPFLPIPTSELMSFRATTMYGDANEQPATADVVIWLQWCKGEAHR